MLSNTLPPLTRHHTHDFRPDQPTDVLDASNIDNVVTGLQNGQTHYVDVPGISALRDAVIATLGGEISRENIMITAGVQEARALALQVLGERSAPVAIPVVRHPGVAAALAIRPIDTVPLHVDDDTLLPSAAHVRIALDDGARLIYLENPSRLSGCCYAPEELTHISRELARVEATAVVDQGLAPWSVGHTSMLDIAGNAATTVFGELFPGEGLEGLQVGYLAGPTDTVALTTKLKQIMSICTSTPSQLAALAVADGYAERAAERRERLAALRRRLVSAFVARGHALPKGGANLLAVPEAALASVGAARVEGMSGAAFGRPDLARLAIDDRTDFTLLEALGGAS